MDPVTKREQLRKLLEEIAKLKAPKSRLERALDRLEEVATR